ncbi:MAG: secretion system protein E, partial [Chloroflexales bacterium]
LLQMHADVRATATSRASATEAIARAATATLAGDNTQALAILRRAWRDRRDERLVAAARHAIELDAEQSLALTETARRAEATVEAALLARRWPEARAAHAALLADVALVAAHAPVGGWGALDAAIKAGEDRDHEAAVRVTEARLALAQGRARDAADILARADPGRLSTAVARDTLAARHAALVILCAAGELGAEALAPVEAELEALEGDAAHA